ncbi:GAF domain-containing protein [Profundibacterium mesophilum]|uniref:Two-component system cell cycle sensor kinase and response regulator n=1 Tax=Profundibacterium mesophilum KAUST100406-0324 TaxID=1037889 RepID=A0A921TEM8_9RHOB|nr:GAF domain-containing protein [Profundibacterium mesophilum]KAF0677472.1 two-component system cell cycle sensor kinase and response regulator [Profundibacterium mesophilum KAUST100406-0324]
MNALHASNEARRLQTLRSYNILDTGIEAAFDEITAIAATLCGKPIAMITLIDEERQWIKSEVGLGCREMPIGQSVCARVMNEREVVVIPDTALDPRTRDNPLRQATPPMAFYAGAPLIAPNGDALGALCLLDEVPGTLTPVQIETLRVMAKQVMAQLELRRTLRRADVLRREVDHRVKNSLQTVASLTRMQARRVVGDEAREALDVVQRRLENVAALNSELYRTNAGEGSIDIAPFLASIGRLVSEGGPERVHLTLAAEAILVGSARAGSLAVIVNEFAMNSFKHAFPDDRAGQVTFTGARRGEASYSLVCRDDGVGSPDSAQRGLGALIIESAVEQLDGQLETLEGPGYGIEVVFPI